MFSYTLFIMLLPLLSFIVLGLAGMKMQHKVAGLIGTCSLGIVTILSYLTAFEYFGADRVDGVYQTFVPYNFTWLPLGNLHFDLGILLDPISVVMLIVISTVSLMVHIYSFGYMHGEKGFQRYYAFLSLFTMSMLGLVLATNIFQMYMFWELVGVSSYLLIGFYYPLKPAIAASKKAFIVTRFADMFFLVGILTFGYFVDSFSFSFAGDIVMGQGTTPFIEGNVAKAVAAGGFIIPTALVLMFIGGAGKSAMFPLHIWLPDAMEGPTPVSALIHAATMVVAGVFQIARMFPLWIQYAPEAMSIVVWVGVFTAFYAASVACAQSDIKRVLAFSTISQIGFMLVALGVCLPDSGATSMPMTEAYADEGGLGYMASMFHLFTHAMFKACLFLGAGCIIHAVHSNEKKYMGGLRKYMPITHITFLISCLAIAGIWPFSGFFSKDEILVACYHFSPVMGIIMSGIAAMTAFYMFRLYYVIFWGKSHYESELTKYEACPEGHAPHAPHEAPATMYIPLIVLATITVLCGWLPFGEFVSANGIGFHTHINWPVAISSTILALCGIGLATYMYKNEETPVVHRAAYKRFYMDEVWQYFTHKIVFRLFSYPIAWFDRHIVDGTFNFMAWGANEAGESIRPWQSGDVRQYAVWFLTGTVALALILLAI